MYIGSVRVSDLFIYKNHTNILIFKGTFNFHMYLQKKIVGGGRCEERSVRRCAGSGGCGPVGCVFLESIAGKWTERHQLKLRWKIVYRVIQWMD